MTSKSVNSSSNENSFQSIVQYIEDYVDLVENIPNEIIRQVTRLHEQNHLYNQLSKQLDGAMQFLVGTDKDEQRKDETNLDVKTTEEGRGLEKGEKKEREHPEGPELKSKETAKKNGLFEKPDSTKEDFQRIKAMYTVQKCLLDIQEVTDEKLYIVQSILDQLDLKGRQLDSNFRSISISNNLGTGLSSKSNHSENHSNQNSHHHNVNHHSVKEKDSNQEESGNNDSESNIASSKRSSSRRNFNSNIKHDAEGSNGNGSGNNHGNSSKRGMKRGVKGNSKDTLKRNKGGVSSHSSKDVMNNSPNALYDEPPIDPDEPTYCLCEQVSFGEMICCDNSACAIEWFHFQCVALATKPKGKWYCPNCRGDRSNIPKK